MSKTHDQETKQIADALLETVREQLGVQEIVLLEIKLNPKKLSIKVFDIDDGREIQYTFGLVKWCIT